MLTYQEDKSHIIWNVVVVIATSYLAIHLPLRVLDFDTDVVFDGLYWCATGVLVIDFIFRFRGSNILSSNKDSNSELTKANLLWLVIDLVAAIPLLVISSVPIIQLLQLIKLARIAQYFNHTMDVEVRHKRSLTLSFFLFWLIIAIHWLSCGWLSIIGIDPAIDHYSNYVRALYWNITTLTTVGYGDITPSNNIQMWYSMLVQLLGIGAFGYIIGQVVSVLSKKDPVENQYIDSVELLYTTLKHRHISRDLQGRVMNYYKYVRDEKIGYDESAFLDSLPTSLRTEAAIDLRKRFIHRIPLFKNTGEKFLSEIATKLEVLVATPGDFFFKKGDNGEEMFLIISGEVEVLDDDHNVLAVLSDGNHFGEVALVSSDIRTASVRASQFCNLYKLTKETFNEVVAGHPDIAKEINKIAKARGLK